MQRRFFGAIPALLGFAILLAAQGTPSAIAAETAWHDVPGAKIRLIAIADPSPTSNNPSVDAAIEIELEAGWHTYWRFPGEAGIPTQANFERSIGIRDVALRFPAPERYFDGQTTSIVYTGNVVLPIDLTVVSGPFPPRLVADVTFGVCREICVPADASLTLELDGADDAITSRMAITSARLGLPKVQTEAPPRISRIEAGRLDDTGERTLTIEAQLAPGTLDADLFAEGADGSYIEVPRRVSENGTAAIFTLSTHGLARTEAGRPLALVLVNGPMAVRHEIDADAIPAP